MKTKIVSILTLLFLCVYLNAQERIIGGTAVDISQRPYQAAIFASTGTNTYRFGGGVILNNQWIVTAAHVVKGCSPSSIFVSTGYTNLLNDNNRSSVSQVIIHPDYLKDNETYANDIALLKLSSPLLFGSYRQAAILSNSTSYSIGTVATVSGWGSRSANGSASLSQLYKTSVTIQGFENGTTKLIIAEPSNTSAYEGDSGGPLTINTGSSDIVIGLVEGGNTDNPSANPSIYTNIGHYYDWIKSHVSTTISGAGLICENSTATYTITPAVTASTISLSSNLTLVSLSGSQLTVKGTNKGRAYINIMQGSSLLGKKELWVGTPVISGVTYDGAYLKVQTLGGDASVTRTEWTIGSNVYSAYDDFIYAPYSSGTYNVSVKATNAYGTSSAYTTQVSFSNTGTYAIALNADARIVTVSLVEEINQSQTYATLTSSNANQEMMSFRLVNLKTGTIASTGSLSVQGGTLDFSNVSSGLYVLKLYPSGKEETFKISL